MNPFKALVGNIGLAVARAAGVGPPPFAQVKIAQKLLSPAAEIPFGFAYEISPDVFACVSLYARVIAGLPLQVTITEGEKSRRLTRKKGNFVDVWNRANPIQTDFEMVESFVSNLLVFGTGAILKERFRRSLDPVEADGAIPRELWPLCSAFLTPRPGPGRTIADYRYMASGKEIFYPERDVARLTFWNTGDEIDGLSPLAVAAIKIQTGRNADLFLNEIFKAGGGMPGIFSTKVPLNDEQTEAFYERLRKRFGNRSRWLEPQLYPADMQWTPTSQTLAELAFVDSMKLNTTQIAKVYAIPADLIGVDKSGALNTASVEASMVQWVEFGLGPMLRRIERFIDERILADFKVAGDNADVACKFDRSGMLAVVKQYLERAKAITEIVGGPPLSKTEGRAKLGEDKRPDPGLDVILTVEQEKTIGKPSPGEDEDEAGGEGQGAAEPSPRKKPEPRPRPRAARRMWDGERIDRDAYRDAAEIQNERAEARGASMWREIFDEQEEKLRAAMANTRTISGVITRGLARRVDVPDDLEGIIALIDDAEHRSGVESFLTRVMEEAGRSAIDVVRTARFLEAIAFDVQALSVQRFLREHIDRAIRVPNDTTKRLLRIAIGESWQRGATRAELDQAIADVFEVRRANIRTIARTEVLPALNVAAREGYAQSGVVDDLEWITARDEVVRGHGRGDEFDHVMMDGQVAAFDELWHVPRVNGAPEALRYPGDPKGSAGNIINCRCRLAPRLRGSSGPDLGASRGWWKGLAKSKVVPNGNGHAGVR